MSELQHINREAAENLMSRYLPMFAEFDERGIDYCLVGGLAVVAHCLAHDASGFRATVDADALVAQDYSNADFARDYLRVYAADPDTNKAVYEAVFGEDGILSSLQDDVAGESDDDQPGLFAGLRQLLGGR